MSYYFGLLIPPDDIVKHIPLIWQNGLVDIGQVTDKSINYVCKYHMKETAYESPCEEVEKPFALMSRKPGIGYRYVRVNAGYHRKHGEDEKNYVVFENGVKSAMPRYYKTKIYGEQKRNLIRAEKLFVQTLRRDEECFKKYYTYLRSSGICNREFEARARFYQLPRIRNEQKFREIEKNKRK